MKVKGKKQESTKAKKTVQNAFKRETVNMKEQKERRSKMKEKIKMERRGVVMFGCEVQGWGSAPRYYRRVQGRCCGGSGGAVQCSAVQCTLGKSLYNFPGNERRQELFMTQALESD